MSAAQAWMDVCLSREGGRPEPRPSTLPTHRFWESGVVREPAPGACKDHAPSWRPHTFVANSCCYCSALSASRRQASDVTAFLERSTFLNIVMQVLEESCGQNTF